MSVKKFIVSASLGATSEHLDDWHDRLASVDGVRIVGAQPRVAQIEADDDAAERARDLLGPSFYVEPSVGHSTDV